MALLHCDRCKAELSSDSAICPHCGTKTPFVCAVCGEPISALATIGWSYPFTKEGKPLCTTHAQRICDGCQKPFPQETLTKRVSHWDFFESVGDYLQIPGHYCEKCNATHIDPVKPRARNNQFRLILGIIVLGIVVILLAWLLHSR